MPTVILARHGRTSANASGVLAGRTAGVRLDARGREQAQAAGRRLEDLPLSQVVTSPLVRCRETAALLRPAATAVRDPGLSECDYGEWTGQQLSTLAKKPLWKQVQAVPSAVTFPGGESMASMSRRAVATVRTWDQRILEQDGPGAVWLAVSHGDVIKAILADALGLHLDLFQRLVIDPGSLSIIRYDGGQPFVLGTNTLEGALRGLHHQPRRRRRGQAAVGGGAGEVNA